MDDGVTIGGVTIEPLTRADLGPALAIQARCYPAFLREDERAFASRLDVARPYCLGVRRGNALLAYLLSHGWASGSPPAVGTVLPEGQGGEVLFVHDLAVAPAGRGLGLGRRLAECGLALAAADGLARAELIAVEGAAGFWAGLGFREGAMSAELAAKVAGYGSAARWMMRG